MAKKQAATTGERKRTLLIALGLIMALVCLSSFKGIYVNLSNAYGSVYNPIPDLLTFALGGILLGFILGYWFKGRS